MSKQLIFTLDLEDHRPDDTYPKRYPEITHAILDFLDRRAIKATIFVLGRLAHDEPMLIKEIARRGHEVAYHSHAHIHLTKEKSAVMREQTMASKRYLEDLIGAAVIGYRAPAFSLTPQSAWAVEVLAEIGFVYSSSLLPAKNPIFGFPGAPQQPFYWSNGLLELPAPVARIGSLVVPFLGGFYLRYFPKRLIRWLLANAPEEQCYWTYCHPHDFDYRERFFKIEGTSLIVSALLWFNRKNTFKKMESLFPQAKDYAACKPFSDLIAADTFRDAPTFAYKFDDTLTALSETHKF